VAIHLTPGFEPLPGYHLVERLGRGSFGEVWKAGSPGGGQVALKFIPLDSHAGAVERRALEFITGVRHPNLLALFGSWQIESFLMIGMELADRTLMSRYEAARAGGLPGIPFDELVEYLEGAARGLDYLNSRRHPHPLVPDRLVSFQHRDVKPTNLFLLGDGVKVGDWGLLRMLEDALADHSGPMTPRYAAPEFFRGQTSERSDQYSLAVTAYFLRTGHVPFADDAPWDRCLAPPDLHRLEDARERRALERALASNPQDRWPSCRDLVGALRSAARPSASVVTLAGAAAEAVTVGGSRPGGAASGLNLPRFHYGSVVPPAYFIGREPQLAEAREIIRACQSFLLVGEHRAGKTSFCKRLIHDLMGSPGNQLLAAYLNLQQLLDLSVETFLEHTLLNLMGEIARQVFRCKYTDLMRPDPAAGHPGLQANPAFESFVHIFRLVVSRTQRAGGVSPAPLRAAEFIQFTNDLLDIVRRQGWANFAIFYDEANRLPRELSVDLLVSNEEALNTAGVISVYVASPVMAEAFRESCGREVRLGAFADIDDLRRLLARYYFDDAARVEDLPVAPGAVELLWAVTAGKPFLIQLVAGRSFERARQDKASAVGVAHVEEAHRSLRAEKPRYFGDE
jgi:hypothetical protein